jgi:hypothetical protein
MVKVGAVADPPNATEVIFVVVTAEAERAVIAARPHAPRTAAVPNRTCALSRIGEIVIAVKIIGGAEREVQRPAWRSETLTPRDRDVGALIS